MSEQAENIIKEYAHEGAKLRTEFFTVNRNNIIDIARNMAIHLVHGGKIIFCGNGGSAADAQHLAAEFVNKFQMERPPLPAIAVTTDTSVITAIANDFGFKYIYSKQVKALANKSDILVCISTSGKSSNILEVLQVANEKEITTLGLTGMDGGEMHHLCDFVLHVQSSNTALVQEIHIAAGHLLCRLVDYFLFEAVSQLQPYL